MNTDDLWRGTRAGVLTVTAVVTAAAVTAAASISHGSAKVELLAAGVCATAVAALIPLKGQRLEARDKQALGEVAAAAEARLRLAVGDSLTPLATGLARLQSTRAGRERERLRGEAKQAVLHATTRLVQGQRVRACFFRLLPASGLEPRRLEPDTYSGRSVQPQHVFRQGEADGDAALGMLDRRERRFHGDVDTDPPPGWSGTKSGYRTFVAVPVVAGDTCHGMFTVDALEPGDLDDEEDVGLVDLLAALLAAVVSV